MIWYVSMYPEVWFLDCTAGEWGYANACSSIGYVQIGCFFIYNLVYFSLFTFSSGTNQQTKKLFIMAVHSASGDTLPGNLTIIPSAQKWVFYAIYQHVFPHLYSSEVCSRNSPVFTYEETSQFKPFESLISTANIFNQSKVMICTFHGIWMAFKKAIFSNWGWLSAYLVKMECLLDDTTGHSLAMDVLPPWDMTSMTAAPANQQTTSTILFDNRVVLIALSSSRSLFTVSIKPKVIVLH
jgi:hypothetical protein